MMKEQGYGEDYKHAHNFDDAFVAGESYLPEALHERLYYQPVNRGLEKMISEKLRSLRELNDKSEFQRYSKKE